MHYVYIVECDDGTYYTGYTTEITRRIKEHNRGEGAKYTRGRLPVSLVYKEKYRDKSKAMQREYAIKSLTRKDKENLIRNNN
ncbi:MAG: GIY-YIG nuclease family protein [Bacillota bacterium]